MVAICFISPWGEHEVWCLNRKSLWWVGFPETTKAISWGTPCLIRNSCPIDNTTRSVWFCRTLGNPLASPSPWGTRTEFSRMKLLVPSMLTLLLLWRDNNGLGTTVGWQIPDFVTNPAEMHLWLLPLGLPSNCRKVGVVLLGGMQTSPLPVGPFSPECSETLCDWASNHSNPSQTAVLDLLSHWGDPGGVLLPVWCSLMCTRSTLRWPVGITGWRLCCPSGWCK